MIERYTQFKKDFIIPKDKLSEVFSVALQESRKRTKKYCDVKKEEKETKKETKETKEDKRQRQKRNDKR